MNIQFLTRQRVMASTILGGAVVAFLSLPALAASVDQFRLEHADTEPQNWLLQLGNYAGHSFSRLNQINRQNVANLKVAFTVPLGSALVGNPTLDMMNRPLVDDGIMYQDDGWGAIYKIDVRSGNKGSILWMADGAVSKDERNRTRGIAMWGNAIVHNLNDGRAIAVNRDTGEFIWDKKVARIDFAGETINLEKETLDASILPVDGKLLIGNSGGDDISRGWLEAVDANTGAIIWRTYMVPGPGEPGFETWKDKNQAWKVGGASIWTVGTYDPQSKLTFWGTGNAQPMFDVEYRPGDNLFSDSVVAMNVSDGKIRYYFQYTPNEGWDYDENGVHMLIDTTVNGKPTKILGHWSRSGFFYRLEAANAYFIDASQYVDKVTWTKGIDTKTGRPLEYDPTLAVQQYIPETRPLRGKGQVVTCPTATGGVRWQPPAYNPINHLAYSAGRDGCFGKTVVAAVADPNGNINPKVGGGIRGAATFSPNFDIHGLVAAVDVTTNQMVARHRETYDNNSGVLATAGGLIFTGDYDGGVVAYDDTTLEELWRFNTGVAIKAPPMAYSYGGKEFIAIETGGPPGAGLVGTYPELGQYSSAAIIYVFAL